VRKAIGVSFALLVLAAGFWALRWKQDEPRRLCFQRLQILDDALHSGNAHALLSNIALPAALQNRTAAEQFDFLPKALHDEFSPEGLAVLGREAAFDPLKEIFPVESPNWAVQAGLKIQDCVDFKLERDGLRAEVPALRRGAARRNNT
jgi:hypothetical protein